MRVEDSRNPGNMGDYSLDANRADVSIVPICEKESSLTSLEFGAESLVISFCRLIGYSTFDMFGWHKTSCWKLS